jgi:hypothetical protein
MVNGGGLRSRLGNSLSGLPPSEMDGFCRRVNKTSPSQSFLHDSSRQHYLLSQSTIDGWKWMEVDSSPGWKQSFGTAATKRDGWIDSRIQECRLNRIACPGLKWRHEKPPLACREERNVRNLWRFDCYNASKRSRNSTSSTRILHNCSSGVNNCQTYFI